MPSSPPTGTCCRSAGRRRQPAVVPAGQGGRLRGVRHPCARPSGHGGARSDLDALRPPELRRCAPGAGRAVRGGRGARGRRAAQPAGRRRADVAGRPGPAAPPCAVAPSRGHRGAGVGFRPRRPVDARHPVHGPPRVLQPRQTGLAPARAPVEPGPSRRGDRAVGVRGVVAGRGVRRPPRPARRGAPRLASGLRGRSFRRGGPAHPLPGPRTVPAVPGGDVPPQEPPGPPRRPRPTRRPARAASRPDGRTGRERGGVAGGHRASRPAGARGADRPRARRRSGRAPADRVRPRLPQPLRGLRRPRGGGHGRRDAGVDERCDRAPGGGRPGGAAPRSRRSDGLGGRHWTRARRRGAARARLVAAGHARAGAFTAEHSAQALARAYRRLLP